MSRWSALAVTGLLLTACEGTMLGPPTPKAPAEPEPAAKAPPSALLPGAIECSGATTFAAPRVRRMTAAEYGGTVRALLRGEAQGLPSFPEDPSPNGYTNRADALRVSAPLVQALWDAAPSLAAQAARALLTAPACAPQSEACAQQLLSDFASRAYRRPLAPDELAELLEVYRVGLVGSNPEGAMTVALQVVLQSASLLFHTELGDGASARLTPFEVANQLAYLLTRAPPDARLTALAAQGPLSAEVRRAEAQRLLADGSAREVLGDFAAQWLQVRRVPSLERDPEAYPQWPGLRAQAAEETRTFFPTAVLDEGAQLSELFTASWSTATGELAQFYGARPGAKPGRVTLPEGQRAGVLTQASVLAAHAQRLDSSPTQRGHLVRMRLLCQLKQLAAPENLVITLPPPNPTATTRERFAAHTASASCQSCHQWMDPIGNGFERYDASGAHRTLDNQRPVDASGSLLGTDVDGAFDGAPALGARLARSALARDCFAQHWFEFATAQAMGPAEVCRMRQSAAAFTEGRQSVKELIVELLGSEALVTLAP